MTKITIDRSVVEQVLEALELYVPKEDYENRPVGNVMDALRAALAEPSTEESLAVETVQEPVRCPLCNYQYGHQIGCENNPLDIALAATAQSRQPAEPVQEPVARSLTEDERAAIEYFALNPSMAVLAFSHWLRRDKSDPLQRPAEPVQEPVAWMYTGIKQDGTEHGPHLVWKPVYMDAMSASKGVQATPLYAAPPQRPAEPVQEPFALPCPTPKACKAHCCSGHCVPRTNHPNHMTRIPPMLCIPHRIPDCPKCMSTHAAPPRRKPLTEAEIDEVWNSLISTPDFSRVKIARAIERAHGIGGQP